jgi:uncharacterized membrane protein
VTETLAFSGDLGTPFVALAVGFFVLAVLLLGVELYRARGSNKRPLVVAASGFAAMVALLLAVLRPVSVASDGIRVGPRLLVLVDSSRSMLLSGDEGDRVDARNRAVNRIAQGTPDARMSFQSFGEGPAVPIDSAEDAGTPRALHSDLVAALEGVARSAEEPPTAIVIVSDGRVDRPLPDHMRDKSALGLGGLDVPVHTIAVAQKPPRDASIRSVRLAGAAVAHQPFEVRVEVGCSGGLACGTIPVEVREVLDRSPPETLARGEVTVEADDNESHAIELSITLHRAGPRVIEVAIDAPAKDTIAENDRRYVTLDVARDRVRVLHIAGRPTYDVRAMRTWLKADESVDVVAFFILRTPTDSVGARQNELALIPFPVDELFTTHLPSFDAVVLQDFNAATYGLTKHLKNLAKYVEGGGGLIMVGGPDAFGPGKYAGTALAPALPVQLGPSEARDGVDLAMFDPVLTPAGKVAPVLGPLRDVIGNQMPEMPGTNIVGAANPGATVLMTHPTLGGSEPMPLLALGEYGTGRTIALTVDGTHKLLMGERAAEQAGRAYGALWDGLLGWLMRDPRFESTGIDITGGCVAGEPSALVLRPLPGHVGVATLTIRELGSGDVPFETSVPVTADGAPIPVDIPPLEAGGYAASVRIGDAAAATSPKTNLTPATRRDFACERGGDEWADPRPDPARLKAISDLTGGKAFGPTDDAPIPVPEASVIHTQRKSKPILPPWAWSSLAAFLVGAHWVARRRSGLS